MIYTTLNFSRNKKSIVTDKKIDIKYNNIHVWICKK